MPTLALLPEVPELPLLALLILILVGVAGRILWTLQRILKLAEARAKGEGQEHWEKVEQHLASIRDGQGQALDLRRIEHLLVDIRDGGRRLDERWLASAERTEGTQDTSLPLIERVRARLLSLGFERIEILTPSEYHAGIIEGGGDVLVEARRSGASYKGKVRVEGGLLTETNLRPSHGIFP